MLCNRKSFAALAALAFSGFIALPAQAQGIQIYAAGSLRGVVSELAQEVQTAYRIEVKPTFGGSGSLRERIEHGEKPDLLLSADMNSPHTLVSANHTLVPAIAFARNRMCLISRSSAGVTQSNMIDRMLDPKVRLKTSTPIADPSGDYAWAIFDRIDSQRPGKGAVLKDKANTLKDAKATPSDPQQSPAAALFLAREIDMSITYCSGAAGLLKEVPELRSIEFPSALDPHPVYGIAVLSENPQALRVALFLLSEKGQAVVAQAGLLPVLENDQPPPHR
jgi:molybdate transport system substrate-binding protein